MSNMKMIPSNEVKYTLSILNFMSTTQFDHFYAEMSESYRKIRKPIANWVLEICNYFHLDNLTAHMAICYLDRIQPSQKYPRTELQLLAISCILIAAKCNECEDDIPSLSMFENIAEQKLPTKVVYDFEIFVLMGLNWITYAHTPLAFLRTYLSVGVNFINDQCPSYPDDNIRLRILLDIFETTSEIILLSERYKQVPSSDLAGAIIYVARYELGYLPVWRRELTALTQFDPSVQGNLIKSILKYTRNDLKPIIPPSMPVSSQQDIDNTLSNHIAKMYITPNNIHTTPIKPIPSIDKENMTATSIQSPTAIDTVHSPLV